MAFRIEARIIAGLALALAAHAETVTLAARHDHLKGSCAGTISITSGGIEFNGGGSRKPHRFSWKWDGVQQVTLSAKAIAILSYQDRWTRLYADRQMRFALVPGAPLAGAGEELRKALGRKFVEAFAAESTPLWSLPAKHLTGFKGHTGTLDMNDGGLAFRSKDITRTWLWSDIENVSSAGPYELTLTTFERSRIHYGGRRDFTFQLREPITPERVDGLWRRVTRPTHILTEFTNKEH